MSDKVKKRLIGALVSLGLALAVSYGLISQDTADKVQNKTDQALTEDGSRNPDRPNEAPRDSGAQPAPSQPEPAEPGRPDPQPAQRE